MVSLLQLVAKRRGGGQLGADRQGGQEVQPSQQGPCRGTGAPASTGGLWVQELH